MHCLYFSMQFHVFSWSSHRYKICASMSERESWGDLINYLYEIFLFFCQHFKSFHFFVFIIFSSYGYRSLNDNSSPGLHYCHECVTQRSSSFLQNNNTASSWGKPCLPGLQATLCIHWQVWGRKIGQTAHAKLSSSQANTIQIIILNLSLWLKLLFSYSLYKHIQIITLSKCLPDWNFHFLNHC